MKNNSTLLVFLTQLMVSCSCCFSALSFVLFSTFRSEGLWFNCTTHQTGYQTEEEI